MAMTLLGLFVGTAQADDGAVVRVSDSPPPAPAPANAAPAPPANAGPAPTTGSEVVACDSGTVGDGVGRCRLCGCLQTLLAYDPARGYRHPDVAHIDREAVIYYRYWPQRFYGQPGYRLAPSFPMVYMPTDTTQLGVYYSRVPQWLPNPRMYPRPPRPDEWNRRVVLAGQAGGCGGVEGVAAAGRSHAGPVGSVGDAQSGLRLPAPGKFAARSAASAAAPSRAAECRATGPERELTDNA